MNRGVSMSHGGGAFGIDSVSVRILPDGRMSRRDAAAYLGRAEKTLAMWQMEGKLRGVRVGGRIFYFKDALDRFIQSGAI